MKRCMRQGAGVFALCDGRQIGLLKDDQDRSMIAFRVEDCTCVPCLEVVEKRGQTARKMIDVIEADVLPGGAP